MLKPTIAILLGAMALSGCISSEEVAERRALQEEQDRNKIYVKRMGQIDDTGDPDQLICMRRRSLSSRTAYVETCKTRRQWRDFEIDMARGMNDMKNDAGRNGPQSR